MAGLIEKFASFLPVTNCARMVCVFIGNGLKDPNIALKTVGVEPKVVESSIQSVMSVINHEK